MVNCVKIKMYEKVMRFKPSTLTVGNLAMIFKLDVNQGIYICKDEVEIIIPTETGLLTWKIMTRLTLRMASQVNQHCPRPRGALPN